MKNVIKKTFGGLSAQYYLRQLFFAALLTLPMVYIFTNAANNPIEGEPVQYVLIATLLINMFLYPYARFVYESIIGYFMGDNVFYINAVLMLLVKFFTMAICLSFAMFIAPIGLAYLYYYHSKNAN